MFLSNSKLFFLELLGSTLKEYKTKAIIDTDKPTQEKELYSTSTVLNVMEWNKMDKTLLRRKNETYLYGLQIQIAIEKVNKQQVSILSVVFPSIEDKDKWLYYLTAAAHEDSRPAQELRHALYDVSQKTLLHYELKQFD